MIHKKFHVTGMGAALVDGFAQVTEEELQRLGSQKGAMVLHTEDESIDLLESVNIHTYVAGGSVANTITGIALSGLNTSFIGKVAQDNYGKIFTNDMEKLNIYLPVAPSQNTEMTGRCIILLTPDGERTMHTLIGVAASIEPSDLDIDVLKETAYFISEGYIFDSKHGYDNLHRACDILHKHDGKIVLSLSDSHCVERHHDKFKEFIRQKINLIFGNEAEIMMLLEENNIDDCITKLQALDLEAVITRGEKGAIIIVEKNIIKIPALSPTGKIVDLTGAGDQFAAGFLSAYAQGQSPKERGIWGSIMASEIITQIGSRPQKKQKFLGS